jgi:hypothetical protein
MWPLLPPNYRVYCFGEGSNSNSFDTQIDSTNSGGFADANPVLIAIIEVRIFI